MLNIKENFPEEAIEFLIKDLEGIDITDNKNDSGGLTKFGISKKAYPDIDIEALSLDEAVSIYIRDYWNKIQTDRLIRIHRDTALFLFFNSVNLGVTVTSKIFQKALNNCDCKLEIDGIIGNKTLNSFAVCNKDLLVYHLILETCRKYAELSHKSNNQVFLDGWFNRIRKIINFIL